MGHPKSSQKSFSGKGVFPARYAFTLLFPGRKIFLSPQKLIDRLNLKEDHTVLEIGPGPGYFSAKVAEKLKTGKLFLFDIQQEMLDYSKKRLDKRNLHNVEYHLSDGNAFPFENEMFDVIFMVTVIGEVKNKAAYLKEIHRVLKDNGIVSVSELAGDPDKIPQSELEKLFSGYGFVVDKEYGNKRNFTLNFRKHLSEKYSKSPFFL